MQERKISQAEIEDAILKPTKIVIKNNQYCAMKPRKNGHLLVVYFLEENASLKVITVITTSKISKYL